MTYLQICLSQFDTMCYAAKGKTSDFHCLCSFSEESLPLQCVKGIQDGG